MIRKFLCVLTASACAYAQSPPAQPAQDPPGKAATASDQEAPAKEKSTADKDPSPKENSPPATASPQDPQVQVEELPDGKVRIGLVTLDRKSREIRIPSVVNMSGNELLEFALVHTQGKIHESLLTSDALPLHLNLAFKLLRYPPSAHLYLEVDADGSITDRFRQEKPEIKAAASLKIEVEWTQDGRTRKNPINDWIVNAATGKAMPADPWIYGGSFFYNGKFVAQDSGDMLAIFLSNAALVNFSGQDNQSDEVWTAFPKRVPQEGTPVTVIISPHQPAQK